MPFFTQAFNIVVLTAAWTLLRTLGFFLLAIFASLFYHPKITLAKDPAGVHVLHVFPHDPSAFTQGLIFEKGYLYEGTGGKGKSVLRKIDLETGAVLLQANLSKAYFGEGITALNGKIYQLTWHSGIGFIYDIKTLIKEGTFRYTGQGWGLTDDGKYLILSDGSSVLRYFDPASFKEVRRIHVHEADYEIEKINELEFVKGYIYANIWYTDHIVKISPETGRVVARYDLSGLVQKNQLEDPEAVLNGIAYDEKKDRLFVTGKLWPMLFEVQFKGSSDFSVLFRLKKSGQSGFLLGE
ncbi:MAG: glutamine cyclotransferase [Syntrophobacteraceae bacterium CG23_combo_of_CG06-09_8_20_14_all_50_8]|nr:MAG: glutamine cyclotransferase [Syntrophobacteraceae bacterium CG23_combo_of_CG06-09_8_20_14_all_50_8]PIU48880.1 MAG: glutamine cyclotransferase [Desulfobacterales bacterium CG07_land_8_20_14_0_80_52_14]